MAVTNLNGEFLQPQRPADSSGQNGQVTPPPFKGTQSLPDRSRRHSLPLQFLSQNLWSANTSTASLIETEEAARGEHILDEATVAHRISALRQLNGATRTRHRYAKSTGARNSTYNQPVIVRTYSGTRPQSRVREVPVKKEVQAMGTAELPPVEAFSFKGIMDSIHSSVTEDLERIAEICARSRYSLSDQYEVHMPPHGDGDPFLLHTTGGTVQTGGPTLEAIASDDEQPGQNGRLSRAGRRRTKSMAYGTLETIYSSSKSSEEDKTKKKPAKEIAEEVRGRAIKKAALVPDVIDNATPALQNSANDLPRRKHARSHSVSLASRLIDSTHRAKGDATSLLVAPAALVGEPARPQTSVTHQDLLIVENFSTIASPTMPILARHESMTSNLRPISNQRPSVFSNLSSWLPWGGPTEFTPESNAEVIRGTSHAEGSLRELLKATDADRKARNITNKEWQTFYKGNQKHNYQQHPFWKHDIFIAKLASLPASSGTSVANPEDIELMDSIQRLWKSQKYSDLTIKCKGKIWKVHRSIICTQSKPLAIMIDGVWKEGQEGMINLDDDEPAIVEKMLEFCYMVEYDGGRYTSANRALDEQVMPIPQSPETLAGRGINFRVDIGATQNDGGSRSLPLTNAKVYILGGKYDMSALKDLAARMYREVAEGQRHLPNFAESAELVYENTPANKDKLRGVVIETAQGKLSDLMFCWEFQDLLGRKPEIALDLLRAVGRSKSRKWSGFGNGKCVTCGNSCLECSLDSPDALEALTSQLTLRF